MHEHSDRHSAHVRGLILIIAAVAVLAGALILISVLENNNQGDGGQTAPVRHTDAGIDLSHDSPRADVGRESRVVWGGRAYRKRTGIETVLLIGYDKRTEEYTTSRSGGQADFLVLAVLDNSARTVQLLQLNRDTMARVRVYGVTGRPTGTKEMQICLSHSFTRNIAANDENTKWAVENLLNINIDHTASMSLSGIGRINALAGGVRVTVTDDMRSIDPDFVPGATVTLSDEQARRFVQARQGVGDGRNSSRMRRQRAFINAFVSQTEARIHANPSFINTLVNTFYEVANISASKTWMVSRMNSVYTDNYVISAPRALAAASEVINPQTHYMETRISDDAVVEWVLENLYTPIDPE